MVHGRISTIKNAIETTIDSGGRVVIPKKIREQAGLEPGTKLQVAYRDGRIEIEPSPMEMKIVKKGRLHVVVPVRPVPTMKSETLLQFIDELRKRR